MPLLTERRYPVALTAEQARVVDAVLAYYRGDAGFGSGDAREAEIVADVQAIMQGVTAEDETRQRRRDAIADAVRSLHRYAFRQLMKINPRLASREARPLAEMEVARWLHR